MVGSPPDSTSEQDAALRSDVTGSSWIHTPPNEGISPPVPTRDTAEISSEKVAGNERENIGDPEPEKAQDSASPSVEADARANRKITISYQMRAYFAPDGKLRPFRLLRLDIKNLRRRYSSDWTLFNQLIFASAVYVFFTNILPGITFASDLYVLTGMTWGTIEIVFSTGLCGVIFSL